VLDEVLEMRTADRHLAYLHDQLQSTTGLVDATTGKGVARYDYTSYGDLEGEATNPIPENPFTYTGREDDGSGLYYYRARYYDPALEVFISQDPLGDNQRYVAGNPIVYVDPLGLKDASLNQALVAARRGSSQVPSGSGVSGRDGASELTPYFGLTVPAYLRPPEYGAYRNRFEVYLDRGYEQPPYNLYPAASLLSFTKVD
jgi:RHS repeat-associated protein